MGTARDRVIDSQSGERCSKRLYTIGHSNHGFPNLLHLLRAAGVSVVADVRSQPYSVRYPAYNRPELERALSEEGLGYVFLGDTLGGRPRQPSLYDPDGRISYERVRAMPFFRRGLAQLEEILHDHSVALLCAEEDPLDCHRSLLLGPALAERGLAAAHLRGDGRIESNAELEERLLEVTRVGEGVLDGLFAATIDPDERRAFLEEAYRLQSARKAFRLRPETSGE